MKNSWITITHRLAVALSLAFALTLAVGRPAAAQDGDADGIIDSMDQCPASVALELVASNGCSVCPCDGAWTSHAQYYDCVYQEAYRRPLSRSLRTAVLRHAKESTCGDPSMIRCCTWRKLIYGSLGSCTVMAPTKCSYAVLGKWAENRGTGSCYYNSCTW